MSKLTCPVCQGSDHRPFLEAKAQPVLIGQKCATPASALTTPRGDIALNYCPDCGFVWNTDFDPSALEYSVVYENSLHYSPTFQAYTAKIVEHLVDTYGLQGKRVLDIGCGKGDFLTALCDPGESFGTGYDPSYEGPRAVTDNSDKFRWFPELFDPVTHNDSYDLIVSRYVLEHIPNPMQFLEGLRQYMLRTKSGAAYIEVPNVDLIVNQGSLWDVIYEHCSYFGSQSLRRAFEGSGFEVTRLHSGYSNQFVAVEAVPKASPNVQTRETTDTLTSQVMNFSSNYREFIEGWRVKFEDWKSTSKTVVLWGAGAKTVSFLNLVPNADTVSYIVDINPNKAGHFVPGTGHGIHSPERLATSEPDVIVIMNPIYEAEIRQELTAKAISAKIDLLY